VRIGQAFDDLHGVERRYLRAADRFRKQHGVDAGLAQGINYIVGQTAEVFGLHRPAFDQGQQRIDPRMKFRSRCFGRLLGPHHTDIRHSRPPLERMAPPAARIRERR
jgi:hypothetical protein